MGFRIDRFLSNATFFLQKLPGEFTLNHQSPVGTLEIHETGFFKLAATLRALFINYIMNIVNEIHKQSSTSYKITKMITMHNYCPDSPSSCHYVIEMLLVGENDCKIMRKA